MQHLEPGSRAMQRMGSSGWAWPWRRCPQPVVSYLETRSLPAGQRVRQKGWGLVQPWVLPWAGRAEGSGALGSHLALHEHSHVHEHVVQLTDAVLQLDDLTVPRLNLAQSLL